MKIISKDNDLSKVRQLWSDCFHDTKEYMDFYFQWKTKDNVILGLYEEEKLVSMVQLNPYQVSIQGQKTLSYYIVGVATDAAYRKRGLMRTLLTESMQQMYDEGVPFTYLMPASEAIYLPFDFRIVTIQKRMSLPLYDLVQKKEEGQLKAASIEAENPAAANQHIQLVNADQTELLDKLSVYANRKLSESEDIYTVRDRFYYQRILAELQACNGGILAVTDQNKVTGYLAFAVEMGKAEVLELICESEVQEALLDQLALEAEKRAELAKLEPAKPSEAPPIMARILNMQKFLEFIHAKVETELTIKVTDPLIPQNCGIYQIVCGPKQNIVTRVEEEAYSIEYFDLSGDVAELTQLFFGQLPGEKADNLIAGNKTVVRKKLDQLHRFDRIHLNEIV